MFLDKYKLESLTLQIQYPEAYELWDKAGEIARGLLGIWPDLIPLEGTPQQQTLRAQGVQITTGFRTSVVALSDLTSMDKRSAERLVEVFKVWRTGASIRSLTRVSTRAIYTLEHPSLRQANAAIRALNLTPWPTGKIFDQSDSGEKNTLDIAFKFEDEKSFAFLHLRTEEQKYDVKLEPPFSDRNFTKTISRQIVDFDRGLLEPTDATTFRMDDWLKGCQHLLRRDIDKVLGMSG